MKEHIKKLIPEKDIHAFWLSFILCLLCCCGILFIVAPLTGLSQRFGSGNDGYIQIARSIVNGDGYVFRPGGAKVFHRPPLYPILLTTVAVFPEQLQRYVIILPQSLMVGITGFLIFKIARSLLSLTVAKISLLLFLLNPWVYWNAKNPMTAVLQMMLYVSFIYLFGRLCKTLFSGDNTKNHTGLQVGFTAITAASLSLTHAAMLPVSAIAFFALLAAGVIKKSAHTIKASVIAIIILIAVIAPWTYRNYQAFERFIPISGGGGLAYFNGNVHWDFIEEIPQQKRESYIDASLRIIGIDGTEKTHTHWKGFKNISNEDQANKAMSNDIKNRPEMFAKKVILNAVEYYFPALTYPFLAIKRVSAEQIFLTFFHGMLWIFAAVAIAAAKKELSIKLLLGLLVILIYGLWYFPFATFIGHSLYTLGTIPFLSILAGCGFSIIARKLFSKAAAMH